MKKVLALALALVMVFSLVAISADAEDQKDIVIGLCLDANGDNMANFVYCLEKRVAELDEANDYNLSMVITDAQGNMDKQLSDIESLIIQDVDVIILSAVDTVGALPGVAAITEVGIPCIDIRGIDSPDVVHYVGMDNAAIGQKVCNWLTAYLDKNPDETLYTGVIYGAAAQVDSLKIGQAVVDLAKEDNRIVILDEKYGDWSTETSMNITEDWLQAYENMNCIVTCSDEMALGVTNVIESAGRTGEFIVTGVDGTTNGIEMVKAGKMSCTVGNLFSEIFAPIINVAVGLVDGSFTDTGYEAGADALTLVDLENVEWYAEAKAADVRPS